MPAKTGKHAGATEKILSMLADVYPEGLTGTDIAEELGCHMKVVSTLMAMLMKPSATLPKRVFITRWEYRVEGQKRYPRPVYKLGDSKNKTKPKVTAAETKRGVYHRKKMRQINSVFAYAQHIHSNPKQERRDEQHA